MSVTVDVRDLIAAPGSSRALHVSQPVAGLSTELARVPEDQMIEAQLVVEGLVEGILASGSVQGTMRLTCARCLTAFDSSIGVRVQEMFAADASADDDEYPLVEGMVDLEPMIRDALILAMPFAPLCRTECLGLCSRCGGDLNKGECTCPPEFDERWAPLLDLIKTDER